MEILEIPLTKGKAALVDAEDYETLSSYKWCCSHAYAVRSAWVGGKTKSILMHRAIIDAPDGINVDHINGNPLDNRRCNLRLATQAQNLCNKGPQKNNKSGFKGVSYSVHAKRWTVRIGLHGSYKNLGYYSTPEEAHAAYCVAALKLHGEFARTV